MRSVRFPPKNGLLDHSLIKLSPHKKGAILLSTASRLVGVCVTLFSGLSLLDVIREVVVDASEESDWLKIIILLLGYACMGFAPWIPSPAAIVSLFPLILVIVRGGGTGVEPLMISTCLIALAIKDSHSHLITLVICYGVWSVGVAIVTHDQNIGWFIACVVILSLFIGLIMRHFVFERVAAERLLFELAEENRRICVEERLRLSRELHDCITHELTIISLQILAHETDDDPAELRTVLERIKQADQNALNELRTMVGVLRSDFISLDELFDADDNNEQVCSINDTATSVCTTLSENGFFPDMSIEPMPESLNSALHNTISRILTEATTNILRYARPRTNCLFLVHCDGNTIFIKISSDLKILSPAETVWYSTGLGLRGLQERVSLTGGTFTAQPIGDQWIVTARLPYNPNSNN